MSILLYYSSRAVLLAFPVVDAAVGAAHMPHHAHLSVRLHLPRQHGELLRVRILHGLGCDHGAHRQVAQLVLAGVDELVRCLGTAGRTGDEIPLPDRVALLAHAQFAAALQDEEHLFIGVMIVERKGALAWRHGGNVVAQRARTNTGADRTAARAEAFGGSAGWLE